MLNTEKNIQIVIVEDEPHNSRMLHDITRKLRPEWNIITILEGVEESVEWLNTHPHPDLILMDIQLVDGICFSIFDQVNLDAQTQIIFTTAYNEYAIRAFKVNSVDYLLKPIKESELETAFAKFEQGKKANTDKETWTKTEDFQHIVSSILGGKKEYRSRFLITGASGFTKVNVKDIAYFYSSNKTTFAITHDKQEHILDYTLEQVDNQVDPEIFFRANRQFILQADAVEKIHNEDGGKLRVITNPTPPFDIIISRLKATEFKEWMGK